MKKFILLLCFALLIVGVASAQEKGFKTIGQIKEVCADMGVEITFHPDTIYENGGYFVQITYSNLVKPGERRLGAVISGSQTIDGANLIEAKKDSILVTRWIEGGTPEKTLYAFTKYRVTRTTSSLEGKIETQVLP